MSSDTLWRLGRPGLFKGVAQCGGRVSGCELGSSSIAPGIAVCPGLDSCFVKAYFCNIGELRTIMRRNIHKLSVRRWLDVKEIIS
jgi:hypothetical protein